MIQLLVQRDQQFLDLSNGFANGDHVLVLSAINYQVLQVPQIHGDLE